MLFDCYVCGKPVNHHQAEVIIKQENRTLAYVVCSECKTSSLLVLYKNQNGVFGIGMLTDLDKKEVLNKISEKEISSDEMIDAYKSLNF